MFFCAYYTMYISGLAPWIFVHNVEFQGHTLQHGTLNWILLFDSKTNVWHGLLFWCHLIKPDVVPLSYLWRFMWSCPIKLPPIYHIDLLWQVMVKQQSVAPFPLGGGKSVDYSFILGAITQTVTSMVLLQKRVNTCF